MNTPAIRLQELTPYYKINQHSNKSAQTQGMNDKGIETGASTRKQAKNDTPKSSILHVLIKSLKYIFESISNWLIFDQSFSSKSSAEHTKSTGQRSSDNYPLNNEVRLVDTFEEEEQ